MKPDAASTMDDGTVRSTPDGSTQDVAPQRRGRKVKRRVKVGDSRIREAIIAFRGNLTSVAKHVGLTRQYLNTRVRESPELDALCAEMRALHGKSVGAGRVRQPESRQVVTDDQIEAALRQYSVFIPGALALPARALGITLQALRDRVDQSEALRWVIESIGMEVVGEALLATRALARGAKLEDRRQCPACGGTGVAGDEKKACRECDGRGIVVEVRRPHWAANRYILEALGGLVVRAEVTGAGGGPLQFRDVTEERRRAAVELRIHEERAA